MAVKTAHPKNKHTHTHKRKKEKKENSSSKLKVILHPDKKKVITPLSPYSEIPVLFYEAHFKRNITKLGVSVWVCPSHTHSYLVVEQGQ